MARESIKIKLIFFNVEKLAKMYNFKAMSHNFGRPSLSLF
jgi:hypothetical protein